MANKIVLGTVQFGMDYGINNSQGKVSQKEVYSILDFAYQNQINMLDTAPSYGDSERVIGKYLKQRPNEFEIVSKLPSINSYPEIKEYIDRSCQHLNINKLYAYLVHDFNIIKKLPGLIKYLKDDSRIEKFGFSLYYPKELDYLLENNIQFNIVQIPYNVFDQRFVPYFKKLKDRKIEIHVRSIFLQGLVFKSPGELTGSFIKLKDKIKMLRDIGNDLDVNISSLCLNFAVLNKFVDKIIIGVDNKSNLVENLRSPEDKEKIIKIYNQLIALKEDDEKIILPINWK